jgi:hypothetical protein
MLPVLPVIDLMLLAGWTSLAIGFVLKAVTALTNYKPTILTLSPIDFLFIAVAAFLFAIALAARTWVAEQQPSVSAARRKQATLDAYNALHGNEVGAARDGFQNLAADVEQDEALADPAHRTG